MVSCAFASSLSAQQYGQWTWDASIMARERSHRLTQADETISDLQQRESLVSVGVNGFLMHPAIAAFRLGVDTRVSRGEGGGSFGSRKLGYRGDLKVFPTGAYPMQFYASRQTYKFGDEAPTFIGSIPDQITTFGARVRVRTGPLTGLIARAERTSVAFLGPDRGTDSQQFHLADWSGGRKAWRHHYRFERQVRDFAIARSRSDEISLLGDDSYRGALWQWTSSSQLVRRGYSSPDGSDGSMTALRMQNRFLRTVSNTRSWEVQHSSGLTVSNGASQSHSLGGRYVLELGRHMTAAPFASIGIQKSPVLDVLAPQAGFSASWTAAKGPLSALISASASSLGLRSDGENISVRETTFTTTAGSSLSLRPRRGLHWQIDAHVSSNELRRSGETITASTVIVPEGGVGTEDRVQARVAVGRRWKPFGLNLYVDWTEQNAGGDLQLNGYSAERLSTSLQVTMRSINFSTSIGNVTVEQNRQQELRFVSAAARIRVLRSASITANHREERRSIIGEPELEGTRTEAGLSIRFGAYSIEPQAFISTQRLDGPERIDRGFNITIGRSFGGVLPIVTGVERRGVVR